MQAKVLVAAGGRQLVQQADRWGRTPLDEAKRIGHQPLVELLESAEDKPEQQQTQHSESE